MLTIRNVNDEDLPVLIHIENQCFTEEEAATEEAFKQRIQQIPDSFFVAEKNSEVAGYINGPVIQTRYITDDLFTNIIKNPTHGHHQSILGLAVSPKFQREGVARALLQHLDKEASAKSRETITLTCKGNLISFYEKHGYVNEGVSDSTHGGVVWYNMSKMIKK
ncbi:GNAT family N-acetyltransferase [Bacillus shivajii]|uniref:GNAT family N-acetyltransferase n=1 Tax=Bacillus shivajii TaxID=1983719 RepID=UPI001CFADD62|nr:N-acetyltransferase [Bacillus shivajii]UCZ54953.1 GNAT family N-acetyltransferase [Bacillus shivajii]